MASGVATVTMEVHGFGRWWIAVREWFLAAGIVCAAVAAAVLIWRNETTPAAPATRFVEPRFVGDAWAPFRATVHAGASSLPIAETRSRGVRELLLAGEHRRSLDAATAAAQSSKDARLWNDLAATRHEAALRFDAPDLLAQALAAADRAIELDPRLAEAVFNRALIIEHLGLRDDAREAWKRYIDVDATSKWADEARDHIKGLPRAQPFLTILDREYERVAADDAAAAALVERDAFAARAAGVKDVLGRWGTAHISGDAAAAARHLDVARRLGAAVARKGDRMLARAVAAIDAAGEPARSRLAAAHVRYGEGTLALDTSRPAIAEAALREAQSVFTAAGSPMALAAAIYAANAIYERGQRTESERQVRELLGGDHDAFPAYRAALLRQLGTCHANRGEYGTAITLLEQSAALFDEIGEASRSAAVRRILAYAYDSIGDPATAWSHRVASLHGHGAESSKDLAKVISTIAHAAMLRHDWDTAASFLGVNIDVARRLDRRVELASALLSRAMVRDRRGDAAGARADLADAKAAIARVEEPAYRDSLRFEELRAVASLRETPAAVAESLLTEAIEFRAGRKDLHELPGLLLQRARARRSAGDSAGAMADLERGIAELERHRESLPQGEARWGAFHAAEELFADAVDLRTSQGDAVAAFAFAERGRARALLETYGRSPVVELRPLPRDTVVVEYVALPSRLVIFTASADGVEASSVPVAREALAKEIEAFTGALRRQQHVVTEPMAAALHPRLVAPVATKLLRAKTVVFVPDAVTATVPFSALIDDGGKYLVERHAIVIASSAATFAAAAERRARAAVPRSALLISADDAAAGAGALAYVDAEMRQIAQAYRSSIRINDDGAQFDELVARAPEADVIAFGGHAVGDERGYEPASIVLRQNGRERRVGVKELMGLRLRRAAVVVLAGCGTARGERRAAEGVISVAHGFLTAGAPSVIATLWPISDQHAATFFPRLHRKLAQGLPPAEALREVQIESIRTGDVPPSLWAAVQDIGS